VGLDLSGPIQGKVQGPYKNGNDEWGLTGGGGEGSKFAYKV
jgi:hypothetical protein